MSTMVCSSSAALRIARRTRSQSPITRAALLCLVILAAMPGISTAQLYATLEVDTVSPDTDWADGFCSLREAILNINNQNGGGSVAGECESGDGTIGNKITFSQAVFGAGATISFGLTSGQLPEITSSWTTVDGWSAGGSGYTGPPLVTLDGAGLLNIGSLVNGIDVNSDYNKIRGLAVVNFKPTAGAGSNGIQVGGSSNWVYGNHVGLHSDGVTTGPNFHGIFSGGGADGTRIGTNGDGTNDAAERNVVSANQTLGVSAFHGVIAGNYIGTDASGMLDRGNGLGVQAYSDVEIGGESDVFRNVISGNTTGILVMDSSGQNVLIQNNFIGTDFSGSVALGNVVGVDFLPLGDSVGTTIRENVISGNSGIGLEISSCSTETCSNLTGGHRVLDNLIGLSADGTSAVGNGGGINLEHSPDNLIRGNTISCNQDYGIHLYRSMTTGNTIESNTVGLSTGGELVYTPQDVGISISEAPGNSIRGNTLSGNLVQLSSSGLMAADPSNHIYNNRFGTDPEGNYLTSFDAGVYLGGEARTVFERNRLSYFHKALTLSGIATPTLVRNEFSTNAGGGDTALSLYDYAGVDSGSTLNCFESNSVGVDADETTGNVDLENNWWGEADGPSGAGPGSGDSVTLGVSFTPWLTQRPSCGVVLFADGFETADTSNWSSTSP